MEMIDSMTIQIAYFITFYAANITVAQEKISKFSFSKNNFIFLETMIPFTAKETMSVSILITIVKDTL